MKYKCGALTNKGNKCQMRMKIEGALCQYHKVKEIDPILAELLDNFDVDKFFQLTELKQEYCQNPDCEKPEKWRSMKCCVSEMYVLSSLGRLWSCREKRLLIGGDGSSRNYRTFTLTDDNGRDYRKGIHTWLGIVFFGLPFLDKDSEQKDKEITIDHIDSKRTKDNFVCCNLRPATKSTQNKNRKKRTNVQGKTFSIYNFNLAT